MNETKIETTKTENDPKFSWAYAMWGIWGFLFHRINIEKRPFWKSAGVDIICWMFVIGLCKYVIASMCPALYIFAIMLWIMEAAACGYIGAWRFNKYKKADWDVETWKRRDYIGGVSGAIGTSILFIFGMI